MVRAILEVGATDATGNESQIQQNLKSQYDILKVQGWYASPHHRRAPGTGII